MKEGDKNNRAISGYAMGNFYSSDDKYLDSMLALVDKVL